MFLTISAVQVWATEETVTLSSGTFSTDHITWSAASGNITISQLKGTSTTAVNSSYISAPRVYKGHVLSFEAATGYKINSIEITVNGTYYGNSMTAGTVISSNTVTDNTTDVNRTWTTTSGGKHVVSASAAAGLSAIYIQNVASTNTQLRFSALKITYTSTNTTPSLSVSPASWDFGTIHASSEASKVFNVSGSNLTSGTLTLSVPEGFSVSPSSIAVNGSLANTEVTVSKNTSTLDTYEGNLSITGGGLASAKTVALTMTVDEDPEPTGTFELFSGDLEEGDYVMYYSGKAMNNVVSSNRLGYITITPMNDVISNPDNSIIWHIAKSTSDNHYWIIYNAAVEKYVASTGAKNQAQLLAELNNNNQAYGFWSVSGTATYDFVNVYNSTNKINANLRNNTTYGFACYATGTGGALTLYKKSDGRPSTPSFSVAGGAYLETKSVTISCATQGASIYYTLDGSTPTSSSTAYTGAISINESKVLKAVAIKDDKSSNVATAEYTIYTLEHAGTEADPYSPEDAKAIIEVNGTQTGAYVSGIVSSIAIAYNSQYGNISFFISADGTVEGTQVEAFRCKGLNNVNFASADDLVTGATVVVYGNLTKYNSTYELEEGCYLTSYEAPAQKTDISNTKATAYTVAEALALAADLNSDLTKSVYVKGVVYQADGFNAQNGTYNIYIKDADADNQFEFFTCEGLYNESQDEVVAFEEGDVREGDQVIGYGVMAYYTNGSIWELKNDYLVELVRPTFAVTGVELDQTTLSIKEGATATLTATVAPANATDNSVTWSSSNEAIATVEDGVVTAVAIGNATITVTTTDGGFTATCAVTVTDPNARNGALAVFRKVTSTEGITDGEYLIVYEGESSAVAFDGALETLDAVGNTLEVTIENDMIVAYDDAAFTIDATVKTIKSYSGKYIGQTSNANGLASNASTSYENMMSIDEENFVAVSGGAYLRFNATSGQDRFRYFKSSTYTSQKAIQLYKKVEPASIRDGLSAGKWGTFCPQKKVLLPQGASFYTLTYKEERDGAPYKVFFDEIGENESLEAGKPYLFIADGTDILGVEAGAAANAANNYNGFHGIVGNSAYTLTVSQAESDAYKYYIIYQNQIRRCGVGDFNMAVGRAYIDMSEVSATAIAPAPGRRRVGMADPEAPQHYTGIDAPQNDGKPVKMLINGQLFIIRNGQLFDTTGRMVK